MSQSLRGSISAEEWRTRVDLACAYRLIAHHGWDDLIFTHLSARVPGPDEHFLINPIGLLFEEITASSLVKVDLAGNILSETPYSINPAGFIIHSCVHAARHDVGAVFHTHSIAGVAVASQRQGLLPISQTELQLHATIAYHDYEGIALDADEQQRLIRDLGPHQVLILRNHGLLSAASDVAETYLIHFLLEKACAIQIAALAGGTELLSAGSAMAEKVARQANSAFKGAAALNWAAARRKMARLDPSFET
jgi:ribulose-5-phosphate 4-epimerase/fuculose-1-phosphate aldolase